MAEHEWAPQVCVACGHVIGKRDGVVYKVIDGKEGIWCPGCAPKSSASSAAHEQDRHRRSG
jgi:hypothetical protein